jgi:hypothetical protein
MARPLLKCRRPLPAEFLTAKYSPIRRLGALGIAGAATFVGASFDLVAAEEAVHTHVTRICREMNIPPSSPHYESRYIIVAGRVERYILDGALDRGFYASELADAPAQAIWPHRYAAEIASIEEQNAARIEKRYSTQHGNCKKCGVAKATSRRVQTRSLDEGITLYVTCICGAEWTVRG